MEKITSVEELHEAIGQLEEKKKVQRALLMEEFSFTREKVTAGNIVKSAFHNVVTKPSLLKSILILSVGLTAAFITKKYMHGLAGRIVKNVLNRMF